MQEIPDKPLFTLREVAEILQVTTKTLTNWLNDGKMRGHKVGGQFRVPREEVMRLVEGEAKLPD